MLTGWPLFICLMYNSPERTRCRAAGSPSKARNGDSPLQRVLIFDSTARGVVFELAHGLLRELDDELSGERRGDEQARMSPAYAAGPGADLGLPSVSRVKEQR